MHAVFAQSPADRAAADAFSGLCHCLPVIGGLGNVDDNHIEFPAGAYRAATLRLFDPARRLWSIWWVDGGRMRLDPPVHGRFEAGIGTFFGEDTHAGAPVRVRFLWSETGTETPGWEQAFSADGGATWETNWIMQFARAG